MILFLDTETTGIKNPRLVQISWIKQGYNKDLLDFYNTIVKPVDFIIPKDATTIHGITTEVAYSEGKDIKQVLEKLISTLNDVDLIVGHNLEFDIDVVAAELSRHGFHNPFKRKEKLCTMKTTTDYCAIPNYRGYKWPSLSELYQRLFNYSFEEHHDAKSDVLATSKCYWELLKRKVIEIPKKKYLSRDQELCILHSEGERFKGKKQRPLSLIAMLFVCDPMEYEIKEYKLLDSQNNLRTVYEVLPQLTDYGERFPLITNGIIDVEKSAVIQVFDAISPFTTSTDISVEEGERFFFGILA